MDHRLRRICKVSERTTREPCRSLRSKSKLDMTKFKQIMRYLLEHKNSSEQKIQILEKSIDQNTQYVSNEVTLSLEWMVVVEAAWQIVSEREAKLGDE